MQTFEELNAKHAAELAKLNAEHALASLAPIPPKRVQITTASLGDWLIYDAADLWGALDIMSKFQPIPFEQFKGTFSRFVPEALNVGRDAGAHVSGPFVAKIDVSQGEGFGPTVELRFFAKLGETICEIHVKLQARYNDRFGQYGAPFQAHDSGRDEMLFDRRYRRGTFRQNNKLGAMLDHVIRWASGEGRSAHYQYSIAADSVNADGSAAWLDAFLRLENVAEAMHGERPASIVSRHICTRENGTGELLEMSDGSAWFHPNSGAAPVCERKATEEAK